MGLFGPTKPKVTKDEFRKAIARVSGLSTKQRVFINDFFGGDVAWENSLDQGLTEDELSSRIIGLRDTAKMSQLTDSEIQEIEGALKKML